MIEKPKVLKCTLKVLENRSTFEMYLSTSTSTEDFPEMYLSTFQVLYKLYLSTDVLKYKVLLPGSGRTPSNIDSGWTRMMINDDCRLHSLIRKLIRKTPCIKTSGILGPCDEKERVTKLSDNRKKLNGK